MTLCDKASKEIDGYSTGRKNGSLHGLACSITLSLYAAAIDDAWLRHVLEASCEWAAPRLRHPTAALMALTIRRYHARIGEFDFTIHRRKHCQAQSSRPHVIYEQPLRLPSALPMAARRIRDRHRTAGDAAALPVWSHLLSPSCRNCNRLYSGERLLVWPHRELQLSNL
jgi:hypothetical protein